MPTRRCVKLVVALSLVMAAAGATLAPSSPASAYTTIVYNGAGSAPRIGIIGDSTIAALRWTNRFEPLKRFNFIYDAESCRRTAITSCRGREGYTPENVITTMRRLSGQWGRVLVLMTGYDDPGYGFASAVDAVMTEASRQGIPRVMWLTMRTADVSYVGPGYSSNTYTFRDNNRILLQKSLQYGGRLQVADWATYSASRSDWFYSDGIHLNIPGSDAAATFIANQAARVIAGETVTPQPGVVPILDWVTVRRGDRGASVVAVQQALIERGYSVLGGADGVFGSVTEGLVRRFQQANGLTVTGRVDEKTANLLGLNNAGGVAAPAAWTDLRLGMAGTGVVAAQRALMNAGIFVRGGADGVFSVYTHYAVQTFQRRRGFLATGVIDAVTAKALNLYSGAWIDLRLGMTGTAVRQAQEQLVRGGIHLAGGVTGTFSVGTYYAVRTFQRFQRLPVTGVIDAQTSRALGTLVAPHPSSVWSGLLLNSQGARVANAQRALMNAGIFVRGGATGTFDVYTYYAVRTFQRLHSLPITGLLDAATARALGLFDPDDLTVNWRDLRLGTSGDIIARIDQALIAAGIFVRGGVNESFDLGTYYAVATYQRLRGLPVTGAVDYATARSLGIFDAPATASILAATTLAAPATVAAPAPSTTTTTTTTTTTSTTTTSTTTVPPTDASAPPSSVAAPATVTLGDRVWLDADGDGRQAPDEVGIADVELILYGADDAEMDRTRSDLEGRYEFAGLTEGSTYRVEIEVRSGLTPAPWHVGDDPAADSDLTVDPHDLRVDADLRTWATTEAFVLDQLRALDLDLGFVDAPDAATTTTEPAATTTTTSPTTTTTTSSTTTTTVPVTTTEAPTTTEPAPTTTEAPAPTSTLPPETTPPTTEAPTATTESP